MGSGQFVEWRHDGNNHGERLVVLDWTGGAVNISAFVVALGLWSNYPVSIDIICWHRTSKTWGYYSIWTLIIPDFASKDLDASVSQIEEFFIRIRLLLYGSLFFAESAPISRNIHLSNEAWSWRWYLHSECATILNMAGIARYNLSELVRMHMR
jgi:hypothetical protein